MEPLEESYILNGKQRTSVTKIKDNSSPQLSRLWTDGGVIKDSPGLENTIFIYEVTDYVSISTVYIV